MDMSKLKTCFGNKLNINGDMFTLSKSEEISGDFAVWDSLKYRIYATPNYEGTSLPMEIYTKEGDRINKNGSYNAKISSVKEYFSLVKSMAERVIKDYEASCSSGG